MVVAFIFASAFLLAFLVGCAAPFSSNSGQAAYYISNDSQYYSEEEFNTEEYSAMTENRFKSVSTSPLSTFAADVDTASYANIRRMINEGVKPEADAVRIEEMLNYFHYDYPETKQGEPFSVTTEISDCPWNKDTKLLLIGLQAQKIDIQEQPPANLVFLMDVSGSMSDANKLPLMKRAFILLAEQLRPEDRVSIVTYASSDRVVIDGATGDEKSDIMRAIENLDAGGSTAGSNGIETAYMLAEKYFVEKGNNRIILGTDGDLNVGITSEGALKRLVENERESGIYLSVMGFGEGNIKDNKMETLADNGNGNYSYIDDINEARKVLVEEIGGTLLTVAKDVKLQVEFNPAVIKGYRLIGYENRLLNDEDFNDDVKDGGEIGSGHRVTAIYEIVPVNSPFEVSGSELKYQQQTMTTSEEWATVNIRYKQPDQNTSDLLNYPVDSSAYSPNMSENMKLAAAICEFGMLLKNSEYAGTASFDSVRDILLAIHDLEQDSYISELLQMVTDVKTME
jgi:Ca-activated chloride channel family protein